MKHGNRIMAVLVIAVMFVTGIGLVTPTHASKGVVQIAVVDWSFTKSGKIKKYKVRAYMKTGYNKVGNKYQWYAKTGKQSWHKVGKKTTKKTRWIKVTKKAAKYGLPLYVKVKAYNKNGEKIGEKTRRLR